MSTEAPLPLAYGFRYMQGFDPMLHAIRQAARGLENVNDLTELTAWVRGPLRAMIRHEKTILGFGNAGYSVIRIDRTHGVDLPHDYFTPFHKNNEFALQHHDHLFDVFRGGLFYLFIKRRKFPACLAGGQMQGIGKIHAVFAPLQRLRHCQGLFDFNVAEPAQLAQSIHYDHSFKAIQAAQYPLGFKQNGLWNENRFLFE